MIIPPILKPVLTEQDRINVDVANIILDAHGEINTAVTRAVLEIAGGSERLEYELDILDKKVDGIMRLLKRAAYLRAGLKA